MKKRKYIVLITLIILSFLSIYLFFPLGSDKYIINWNQEKLAFKQRYLLLHPVNQRKQSRPNIILIIADDLGKTDISLYGDGKVHTPNIDKLGSEGVIFDEAYVTSPVCSPSRASMLTGRYPQRFGFVYQIHEFYLSNRLQYFGFKHMVNSYPWIPRDLEQVPGKTMTEKQGLPPSEITLPEILKKEGYRTALVGKWHLGEHHQNVPCNFGFDYHYGFYGSHSLYAYEDDPDIVNVKIENDFSDPYIWKGQRDGRHAIYINCELHEEEEYLTSAITRECKEFISTNSDTSFFLIASYNAPHTPLQALQSDVQKFSHIKDPAKRVYYAMISSLDDAVGELQDHLKHLNIAGNTLIFFISDNGGAAYTHTTDNYPLKGGKITDFEGGLNVPFIIKWPEHLPRGIHYPHPVSSMDIFGTVASLLDVQLPDDRIYDGVNLLPYLQDSTIKKIPHDYLFWNRGDTRAIRSVDWKMVWNEKYREKALYNMSVDNLEKRDLLSEYPDVSKNLEVIYNAWLKNMKDPLWPPLIYFVYEDNGRKYHFDN